MNANTSTPYCMHTVIMHYAYNMFGVARKLLLVRCFEVLCDFDACQVLHTVSS